MTTISPDIDKIDQRAEAVQVAYSRRADEILSDRDLTSDAHRRLLDEATANSRAQLADLMVQRNAAQDAVKTTKMRELFGYIIAPTGTDVMNRRDADERAARLGDQASALEALRRAELTGDQVFARSIALAALNLGWSQVVSAYSATHPSAAAALAQLAAIEHEKSTGLYGMRYSLMARRL